LVLAARLRANLVYVFLSGGGTLLRRSAFLLDRAIEMLDTPFFSVYSKTIAKKRNTMGRSRDYDENAVLNGAMHAFRHHGYESVSIRDLEAATGLKAGSIYNSFGDKAGLFDAAFAHYNQTVLQGRIDRYAPPERGLAGLRKLFLTLLQEPDGGKSGCLITNSAIELGGRTPIHPRVDQGLHLLEKTFLARFTAAQTDGSLRTDVSPVGAAVKLLALYQGVLVLIRAGHATASLKRLIDQEFNSLEES
jgi:AcrR family transcriptional regulator